MWRGGDPGRYKNHDNERCLRNGCNYGVDGAEYKGVQEVSPKFLKQQLDAVMASTSGSALMKSCAVSKLCKEILPLATLVTPNLSEAEILSDCVISNSEEMKYAAKKSVRYTDVRYLRQLPPILQKDFH